MLVRGIIRGSSQKCLSNALYVFSVRHHFLSSLLPTGFLLVVVTLGRFHCSAVAPMPGECQAGTARITLLAEEYENSCPGGPPFVFFILVLLMCTMAPCIDALFV